MGSVARFKRIYIEITSSCNLNCSFCQETKLAPRFISVDEFRRVIEQVRPYTNFVYLHVKGEPLLHPQLSQILEIALSAGLIVNITTNATLLRSRLPLLIEHPVHQLNISLHSADDNDCIDMDDYIHDVFYSCEVLNEKTETEISMRLWTVKENPKMFGKTNIDIRPHLHINVQSPFEWPDLNSSYYNDRGFCQGLRSHIAILSNGTVVPCCLDGNGCMNLGNIFTDELSDILCSKRVVDFREGFHGKRAVEPLCAHCSFKERFKNKL